MRNDLAARVHELALKMTSYPSVTGSAADAAMAGHIAEMLSFDQVWTETVPNDYAHRSNVFAIKRGRLKRAIVLTGHFDVVSVEDYGDLRGLAFSPDLLRSEILSKLTSSGEHPKALADIESGEFLPGRGLLDMKAGLAAGIAAMEVYAGEMTLVFIGVTDEEERSAGARAAIPVLQKLVAEEELEIELIINLDSISDQGDGSKGRIVTYGSIGKQLLAAYVVGQQTHAGYPQDGVNAAYVMAELVRTLELAPQLAEVSGSEVAAFPTTLFAKDGKQGYNVTTPAHAFAYWNTMQHRRSGAEVLEIALSLAGPAVKAAAARTGWQIALKTMADLPKPRNALDQTSSLPEQTAVALAEMTRHVEEPSVYFGFASIPYPAVLLRDKVLRETISKAVQPYGLGEVNYFAGISDMSFFGEASGDLSVVAANTPIWGTGFVMPEPAGYPCINIGPWGRDYHTWLERLHTPYAFNILPRVLLSVIEAVEKSG
jgi:arginine utilization protein RocB